MKVLENGDTIVKVADFGTSTIKDINKTESTVSGRRTEMTMNIGTPAYVAKAAGCSFNHVLSYMCVI